MLSGRGWDFASSLSKLPRVAIWVNREVFCSSSDQLDVRHAYYVDLTTGETSSTGLSMAPRTTVFVLFGLALLIPLASSFLRPASTLGKAGLTASTARYCHMCMSLHCAIKVCALEPPASIHVGELAP